MKAKAAQTRHLAAYALELIQRFGKPEDREVLAVTQLLCEFYKIIENESVYMSPQAKVDMPRIGRQLCHIYAGLAQQALLRGEKVWKLHPKLHLFVHLCEWQAVETLSPKSFWTYSDEDLVGLLVEVAESCHPSTLAPSALFKWMHVYFD